MITIYDANAYLRTALFRRDPLSAAFDPRRVFDRANSVEVPEIWVWDGARNNERRRAIFPDYKRRDYSGQEDIFAGLQFYRELLIYSKAIQIEVPDYEADDVCATLAKKFSAEGEQVHIWTNDFDYHQLSNLRGVKIHMMKKVDGVASHLVPLYKTLRGDSSDRIPGLPGFGHKSWEKMLYAQEYLNEQFLEQNTGQIIDFELWKPAQRAWVSEPGNVEKLLTYYQIVQFYDVPMEVINKHMYPGIPNPTAGYELLSKFGQ